jgi:predicted DNA binding CopG/RHH family protein
MTNLDKQEHDILQCVEIGHWQSYNNIDDRRAVLQSFVKQTNTQDISLKIDENDIYELKKKALQNATSYENLIQRLIHQFATNKIRLNI